jgi:hypothetical protein
MNKNSIREISLILESVDVYISKYIFASGFVVLNTCIGWGCACETRLIKKSVVRFRVYLLILS